MQYSVKFVKNREECIWDFRHFLAKDKQSLSLSLSAKNDITASSQTNTYLADIRAEGSWTGGTGRTW